MALSATSRQPDANYQQSVALLGQYVSMLDNNFALMTPTRITQICQQIQGITNDIKNEVLLSVEPPAAIYVDENMNDRGEALQSDVDFQNEESLLLDTLEDDFDDLINDPTYEEGDDDEVQYVEPTVNPVGEHTHYRHLWYANKPTIVSKRYANKDIPSDKIECFYCAEDVDFHHNIVFQCGHKMCNGCTYNHMRSTMLNATNGRPFNCPECRAQIKEVTINYTKNEGKKNDILNGPVATSLRPFCR